MTVAALMLMAFLALLALGTPIAVALGLTGTVTIFLHDLGISIMAVQVYGGIAKYPLLALPVFLLAGMLFERAGVAERLLRFASAIVGPRRGGLALVAVMVCLLLGGMSGSGPADAAAVAMVMIPAMVKQGYPKAFSASLIAAGSSTAIIIPPSIAFIIYAVLVPDASVPALFLGGVVPGLLAGIALMIPAFWIARRRGFGAAEASEERPRFWRSFREAGWGLLAPVIILGGLRSGAFTPTEVAVVAAAYGLFVGTVVYRSLAVRDVYRVLVDSAEISAVVMIVVALAGLFAYAGTTLGAFDALADALVGTIESETLMLLVLMALLLFAGMLMDAISIYLIFLPILIPIAAVYGWDPVWLGIVITMNLAIGQFTPPIAVNLMVTTRVADISIESTTGWVIWMVVSMLVALLCVVFVPDLALWLPRAAGYG